jgi:hypothetical protein
MTKCWDEESEVNVEVVCVVADLTDKSNVIEDPDHVILCAIV